MSDDSYLEDYFARREKMRNMSTKELEEYMIHGGDLKKKAEYDRKKKKRDERNGFLIIIGIIVLFFLGMSTDTSTNASQEKSCIEKHKQDYQAYLYCTRMENFNR